MTKKTLENTKTVRAKQTRAFIHEENEAHLEELKALMGHTSISDTVNYVLKLYLPYAIAHQKTVVSGIPGSQK